MTSTPNAPDLSKYRAVHTALRDGAHRLTAAAATLDPCDRARAKALATFWQGYAGEVLTHHRVEDETFFPALVARVPVAGDLITQSDRQHHELDELMARAERAFAGLAAGTAADLLPALSELAAHLETHLAFEDADILPLFERHFTAAEYEALDEAALKSLGIGRQAAFAVPFVLAVLDERERSQMLRSAPIPLRLLYGLANPRYERLVAAAFGPHDGGVDRRGSIRLSETRLVHRPAAEVWAVVADYDLDPIWRRGVTTMAPSAPGPVDVGVTTVEDLHFAGRRYRNPARVLTVDPGHRFSWQSTSGVRASGSRTVTSIGSESTEVELALEVHPTGIDRLLAPILGRLLGRTLDGDADRLVDLLGRRPARAAVDA